MKVLDMEQGELVEILDYCAITGVFRWIKPSKYHKEKKGSVAGTVGSGGYINIKIHGKKYKAHRLAWLYVYGNMPDKQIDHVNHNPSDNRIENLRDVSQSDNAKNTSAYKNITSGVIGVSWSTSANKWRARITVDGEMIYLGNFSEFHYAVNARKNAEVLYGFHENHGKDIECK